jgi:hypothetical protein
MLRHSTRRYRTAALLTLAALLQFQGAFAENRMQLKKGPDNSITIELTNSNPIAGFQFSLQGHGGIVWESYEASSRSTSAGLAIYQYRANDSTLNVVLLAQYRSALPPGQGIIGRIGFALSSGSAESGTDTISVSLGGLVTCDASAQILDISAANLAWLRQEQKMIEFTLEQNYPNPFNPSTTIAYTLAKPAGVRLVIFDVAGRLINSLVNEFQDAGRHTVTWNAGERRTSSLASGMYFARVEVGGQVAIKKMLLTK